MKKICLFVAVICITTIPCVAYVMDSFTDTDDFILQSDAIVIVQANEIVKERIVLNGGSVRRCFVHQVLKGDLPKNKTISIRFSGDWPLTGDRTGNLVFLQQNKTPRNGVEYEVMRQEGANIAVTPYANETIPSGKTTKEQVQTLIRNYISYRDERLKKENALLDKMLQ